VFIPHIDEWWRRASPTLRALLTHCLADCADERVAIVATSDGPWSTTHAVECALDPLVFAFFSRATVQVRGAVATAQRRAFAMSLVRRDDASFNAAELELLDLDDSTRLLFDAVVARTSRCSITSLLAIAAAFERERRRVRASSISARAALLHQIVTGER
jgi:hypothetical protein